MKKQVLEQTGKLLNSNKDLKSFSLTFLKNHIVSVKKDL